MESLLCRSNLCCSNISKTTYPSSNISKVAEISHNLKFITIFSYLLRGGIIWHINSIAGPTHVILDSAQPSFDLGAFFLQLIHKNEFALTPVLHILLGHLTDLIVVFGVSVQEHITFVFPTFTFNRFLASPLFHFFSFLLSSSSFSAIMIR